VQRGEAPLPGVRGCPSVLFIPIPQEWGNKGVERNHGDDADWSREDCRRWAQPTLQIIRKEENTMEVIVYSTPT